MNYWLLIVSIALLPATIECSPKKHRRKSHKKKIYHALKKQHVSTELEQLEKIIAESHESNDGQIIYRKPLPPHLKIIYKLLRAKKHLPFALGAARSILTLYQRVP